MKEINKLSVSIFMVPCFIINLVCLIVGVLLYNKDDAKGFNSYVCALSVYSLHSFFAVLATLRYTSNYKQSKILLFVGVFYILISSIVINEKILNEEEALRALIFLDIILVFPFIVAIIFFKNPKIYQLSIYIILVFSLILSGPAIYLFGGMILWFFWSSFSNVNV